MMIVFKTDVEDYKEHQIASVSAEKATELLNQKVARRFEEDPLYVSTDIKNRYCNRMMKSR